MTGPVRADTTVDSSEVAITAPVLPVTAAEFGTTKAPVPCEPSATEDVWFFAVTVATPSPQPTGGETPAPSVRSIALTFAARDRLEPRVETIGAHGIDTAGTASIRTPAGWTLIGATAHLEWGNPSPGPSGPAASGRVSLSLVLVATCPAGTPERLPLVPAAPPVLGKVKAKATPRATVSAATATAIVASGPVTAVPTTGRYAAPESVPRLPTTGQDVTGMFVLGLALVVAGVLLLIVRRHRDKPAPRPEPSDWY
jgi:LPXTG-motif cell wall-anchored protein